MVVKEIMIKFSIVFLTFIEPWNFGLFKCITEIPVEILKKGQGTLWAMGHAPVQLPSSNSEIKIFPHNNQETVLF